MFSEIFAFKVIVLSQCRHHLNQQVYCWKWLIVITHSIVALLLTINSSLLETVTCRAKWLQFCMEKISNFIYTVNTLFLFQEILEFFNTMTEIVRCLIDFSHFVCLLIVHNLVHSIYDLTHYSIKSIISDWTALIGVFRIGRPNQTYSSDAIICGQYHRTCMLCVTTLKLSQ